MPDVTETLAVNEVEQRSPDANFDTAVYFEQWVKDFEAARQRLNNHSEQRDGTEWVFEALPGSSCEVTFEGVLHFDGHSNGNIHSPDGTLVVTKRGVVDADIEVGTALINGAVTGNITAQERVFLGDEARVTGQIHTKLLSVRSGAVFAGDCIFTGASDSSFGYDSRAEQCEDLEESLVTV